MAERGKHRTAMVGGLEVGAGDLLHIDNMQPRAAVTGTDDILQIENASGIFRITLIDCEGVIHVEHICEVYEDDLSEDDFEGHGP